jgi:hypothetical protein
MRELLGMVGSSYFIYTTARPNYANSSHDGAVYDGRLVLDEEERHLDDYRKVPVVALSGCHPGLRRRQA